MAYVLRHKRTHGLAGVRWVCRGLNAGEGRWIEIVPKIEAHRADRSLVVDADANGVGKVAVVALGSGRLLQTELWVFLFPLEQIVQHVVGVDEDVTRVVEDGKADGVAYVGQVHGRKSQFEVVDEQRAASKGEPSQGVSGACLI